jgi:hypothetical protein
MVRPCHGEVVRDGIEVASCSGFENVEDRIAWCRALRKQFSPADVLDAHGDIRQELSRTQSGPVGTARPWTATSAAKLRLGLQQYGVGQWTDIQRRFLPEWPVDVLKAQAEQLLTASSLEHCNVWLPAAEEPVEERGTDAAGDQTSS